MEATILDSSDSVRLAGLSIGRPFDWREGRQSDGPMGGRSVEQVGWNSYLCVMENVSCSLETQILSWSLKAALYV